MLIGVSEVVCAAYGLIKFSKKLEKQRVNHGRCNVALKLGFAMLQVTIRS